MCHERWRDIYDIAATIKAATPGSLWFNRRLAVMETGFATNSWLRSEREQAAYFGDFGGIATHLRDQYGGAVLLGIYELVRFKQFCLLGSRGTLRASHLRPQNQRKPFQQYGS